MSTLKVNAIRGTGASSDAVTLASDGTCTASITNNLSNRRLNINGAMTINQKSATHNSDGYQVADMWWWGKYSTDQLVTTQDHSTTAPDGFKNSYKLSVATAETTLDSNEYGILRTRIEGQDLKHLKTGTSDAVKTTLSFYAKTASANSGDTYSVCISMRDASGNERLQYRTFTPTSTWQRFTMSFVGQTNNAIRSDNEYGLTIHYVLAAGSGKVTSASTTWSLDTGIKGVTGQSNFFDSTSNEFYVTGVQLEVDSTGSGVATDFEHRSYGDELARCQRYYYRWTAGAANTLVWMGQSWGTTAAFGVIKNLPVTMRATPTSTVSGTYVPFGDDAGTSGHTAFSSKTMNKNNPDQLGTNGWTGATGIGSGGGKAVVVTVEEAAAYIDATAEL